jgi:hypothetical protein
MAHERIIVWPDHGDVAQEATELVGVVFRGRRARVLLLVSGVVRTSLGDVSWAAVVNVPAGILTPEPRRPGPK